jgi:hypothetical protein
MSWLPGAFTAPFKSIFLTGWTVVTPRHFVII